MKQNSNFIKGIKLNGQVYCLNVQPEEMYTEGFLPETTRGTSTVAVTEKL